MPLAISKNENEQNILPLVCRLTLNLKSVLFCPAEGIWCGESPNEVSSFTEHGGQPRHHGPLSHRTAV